MLLDGVLNRVKDHWAVWIIIQPNDSLQPKQLRASHSLEEFNECRELARGHRTVLQQYRGLYAGRSMAARLGRMGGVLPGQSPV